MTRLFTRNCPAVSQISAMRWMFAAFVNSQHWIGTANQTNCTQFYLSICIQWVRHTESYCRRAFCGGSLMCLAVISPKAKFSMLIKSHCHCMVPALANTRFWSTSNRHIRLTGVKKAWSAPSKSKSSSSAIIIQNLCISLSVNWNFQIGSPSVLQFAGENC